jgi:L-fuconolactonase
MSEKPMKTNKRRFVDAHVHLWDVANGWYRLPTPQNNYGLGDVTHFPAVFELDDYQSALQAVDVVKFVHVTATDTAAGAYEETRWLAQMAGRTGVPNAIIGTLDLSKSIAELELALNDQMKTPLYRGIRLLHGIDYSSPFGRDLMALLSDRGLVYDAVAHPGGGIADVARAAERHPALTFVMEHTGWPLKTDAAHWSLWKREMADFASVPGTFCKLSGLGMVFHRTDAGEFRRYWDHCLEIFGAHRCMFASNFPVDRLYGSFDDLLAVFEYTAAGLGPDDQMQLFGGTAERVYRI